MKKVFLLFLLSSAMLLNAQKTPASGAKLNKYKFMFMLNYTTSWMAYGGGYKCSEGSIYGWSTLYFRETVKFIKAPFQRFLTKKEVRVP